MNYFNKTRLAKYIQAMQDLDGNGNGYDFHIHAIGDRGVRDSLDAIEETKTSGTRHRLTHCELVNEQDYDRFAQLDVTADMQASRKETITVKDHTLTFFNNFSGIGRVDVISR